MAFYANPPPAYSAYPAQAPKYSSILEHYPRRASQAAANPTLSPAQFIPGQALTRDQAQYFKSYNRAVAVYNASPRKNVLACAQKGCTNVLSTFGNLVIELHLHEIAANGTCCPICTNWFESWAAKDRHMCPGPGGHCPEEDPDMVPVAPPVQQMAAADPYFFHHSMPVEQYAHVAARRAMETKRSVRPGGHLPCDFHGCSAHFPTEASLMEHIFGHFKHAAGGLCSACKTWLPDHKSRDAHAHKCAHAHSESDYYHYQQAPRTQLYSQTQTRVAPAPTPVTYHAYQPSSSSSCDSSGSEMYDSESDSDEDGEFEYEEDY